MIGYPIAYPIGFPNREANRPRIGLGRIPRPDPTRARYLGWLGLSSLITSVIKLKSVTRETAV